MVRYLPPAEPPTRPPPPPPSRLYRTSKVAQNMLAKGIAEQQANPRGIAVRSLHPGWVQTDMGGPHAKITVEGSAAGLADVIESAEGGYRFVDYSGDELPF